MIVAETLTWAADEHPVQLSAARAGRGATVLLLPALSSISTLDEMAPLQERLAPRFSTVAVDWPGFGTRPRPNLSVTPALLRRYLDHVLDRVAPNAFATVAAGHAAGYLLDAAARRPGIAGRLVLAAPTWRGPLPTVMGRRSPLGARIVRVGDLPLVGSALYRLNVNRPMVGMMTREHVYDDRTWLDHDRMAAKWTVTSAKGARHAALRFVAGELDPAADRDAFLRTAARVTDPALVVYGAGTPPRSKAEIEALSALPNIRSLGLPRGRLAIHEEFPDEVAAVIVTFLGEADPTSGG